MCEETEAVLRAYLQRTLGVHEVAWSIRPSGLGGRGVFATRNLEPGDHIFHDKPILWGPRAKPEEPMCSSCHRRGRVVKCPAGCYLPVCSSACSTSAHHVLECKIVRESMTMPEGEWRLDLVGTVTPLRCLFMGQEDKEVIHCLQGNPGKIHGIEVDLLKYYMKDNLKKEDEEWMRQCCIAMDTNAFEFIKVLGDESQTSLRGLFPLAAMLNNECSPNSCHIYDSEGVMKVFASRPISEGEEVTTSYSALLWSTNIRRMNLARTKHFLCRCPRCADPTEFGSMLSCLPCTDSTCHGLMLPATPLKLASSWFCGSCAVEVSPKEAAQMQAAQGVLLEALSSAHPLVAAQFLSEQSLPSQSQVMVQLKLNLVWQLGHKHGFVWQDLSQDMLDLKENCCRDVLLTLETLRFGLCRMKGLVLMELHAALCEQQRRLQLSGRTSKDIVAESLTVLNSANIILQDDAAAKNELNARVQNGLQISS